MPDQNPDQPNVDALIERVEQNATAVSELQGLLIASIEGSKPVHKDEDVFDKALKVGQLVFPLLIVWLVYYVNAEMRPVITHLEQNKVMIREAKEERAKITSRLNAYDVKEAGRDVTMENMQKDLREILSELKLMKERK